MLAINCGPSWGPLWVNGAAHGTFHICFFLSLSLLSVFLVKRTNHHQQQQQQQKWLAPWLAVRLRCKCEPVRRSPRTLMGLANRNDWHATHLSLLLAGVVILMVYILLCRYMSLRFWPKYLVSLRYRLSIIIFMEQNYYVIFIVTVTE